MVKREKTMEEELNEDLQAEREAAAVLEQETETAKKEKANQKILLIIK